jgi:hypothetical protein
LDLVFPVDPPRDRIYGDSGRCQQITQREYQAGLRTFTEGLAISQPGALSVRFGLAQVEDEAENRPRMPDRTYIRMQVRNVGRRPRNRQIQETGCADRARSAGAQQGATGYYCPAMATLRSPVRRSEPTALTGVTSTHDAKHSACRRLPSSLKAVPLYIADSVSRLAPARHHVVQMSGFR